eukprot:scaffold8737_cov124-Isochrysis_galbana.AAC.9
MDLRCPVEPPLACRAFLLKIFFSRLIITPTLRETCACAYRLRGLITYLLRLVGGIRAHVSRVVPRSAKKKDCVSVCVEPDKAPETVVCQRQTTDGSTEQRERVDRETPERRRRRAEREYITRYAPPPNAPHARVPVLDGRMTRGRGHGHRSRLGRASSRCTLHSLRRCAVWAARHPPRDIRPE